MLPLKNEYIDVMEHPVEEGLFTVRHVGLLERGRDSVMENICSYVGSNDVAAIRYCNLLSKRNITKDKLCEWLETVCCILNSYAVPLLQNAVPLIPQIDQLKSEKIEDQKTVIDLQNQLIVKKDEELEAVKSSVREEVCSIKSTVQAEMKSYSSVVSKSCSTALAPKKIEAAVKKASDREDRSRNLIIYGISETTNESVQDCVGSVLAQINEKPVVTDCCRLGNGEASRGKARPIKFTLSSKDLALQVLRRAKLLRTAEGYNGVYICPDRTLEERRGFKKLIDEVTRKRAAEPDFVHVIRNNKVVSSARDSVPQNSGTT